MTWVNLNDIYVPKTGGTVTGDLGVDGSIVVNDGTGNGTTYDVASEITDLKDAWDSISPCIIRKEYSVEVSDSILYTSIGFTPPTGYSVLAVVHPRSNGWIGSPYVESYGNTYANLWWSALGEGFIEITVLFIKSNMIA